MVSKYSRHPKVAADRVRYFSSPEIQKRVALELCGIPLVLFYIKTGIF
jgi:hypothetical protein